MDRSEIAKMIHWSWIIWAMGFVNVAAMWPQLWKIFRTKKTAGISMGMLYIYLAVQIAFALEGFFSYNDMLMWCLALSALTTLTIIMYVKYLRSKQRT